MSNSDDSRPVEAARNLTQNNTDEAQFKKAFQTVTPNEVVYDYDPLKDEGPLENVGLAKGQNKQPVVSEEEAQAAEEAEETAVKGSELSTDGEKEMNERLSG